MTTSASDAPVTKSESVAISEEAPATPSISAGNLIAPMSGAVTAVKTPSSEGTDNPVVSAHASASGMGIDVADTRLEPDSHVTGGQPGHEGATVSKEEMERYMKISRDLKLRRGSLMPPSGTLQSGKNVTASPSGVHAATSNSGAGPSLKKKGSLTMETRVELYGKGRIKLNFDAVSEDGPQGTGNPAGTTGGLVYQNIYPEDSTTSLVKRGGPSTAITPRRLSMDDKLAPPPPTPAPSMVSIKVPSTFPGKDDE
ncbi:uncharacterized protein LOC144180557 [Haemaphysalis longicornis]